MELYLVTGRVMPVVSASWKASLPIRSVRTWPVMATSGIESIMAVARPVTRLQAPGPLVATHDADLAAGAGVAVGHVAAALLVAGDDEPDRGIVEPVEQGQHDPARVAEHRLDAEIDERVDDDLGAGFDCGGGLDGRSRRL